MKTTNLLYISKDQFKDDLDTKNIKKYYSSCLVQLFTSLKDIQDIKKIILNIKEFFPDATIIGATTDGEIYEGISYSNTTVVSISTFEHTTLKAHFIDYTASKSINFQEVGRELAVKTIEDKTKAVIIFSDGLETNAEDLIKGFEDIKPDIIIAGGLAGDNGKFENTFVFYNEHILEYGSVAVSLNSDILSVTTQYDFNYQSLERDLKITKSIKNRVYEIDGMKAIDIYSYYLGSDIANMLPNIGIEFPLIVQKNGLEVARAVLQKHEDGSLTFGGNISTGDIVHIGYGDIENILDKSIKTLKKYQHINAESTFIYSCMARRRLIGKAIDNELLPFNSISTNCGFFTYGEYFHFAQSNEFLNQTMTVLFLSEDQNLEKNILINENATTHHDNHIVKALSHLVGVSTKEIENKNKQLLKQQKLLANSTAIAAISHQWRQPLTVLSLIISKMKFYHQNSLLNDKKIMNFLKDSEETVDNLSDVIDQFKTLFLHTQNETKAILVQDIIQKAQLAYGKDILENNIINTINYNEHALNIIHTDMDKLINILDIIYENAIESILESEDSKKLIDTSILISHDQIEINIYSSGKKIENEILENIFEPYFSTKDDNERGLGLYIAKILVEHHLDGKLLVSSDDTGTIFTIKLHIQG